MRDNVGHVGVPLPPSGETLPAAAGTKPLRACTLFAIYGVVYFFCSPTTSAARTTLAAQSHCGLWQALRTISSATFSASAREPTAGFSPLRARGSGPGSAYAPPARSTSRKTGGW
jgi:hypothetical protein